MNNIQILPPEVVQLVAAGEVIENPASVVKELVENALDAQATEITIHLTDSGYSRIEVRDNGSGMSREDLERCWLPHATSKLRTGDDLWKIGTLGFRGEALGSLAAASDLTLRSRLATADKGWELVLRNQQPVSLKPVGQPVGTQVIVDHLFAAIPARHRQRQSPKTELRKVVEVLWPYALARPDVTIHCTHEQTPIFHAVATKEPRQRYHSLFGSDWDHLLPLSFSFDHGQGVGFIGKPQLARRGSKHQLLLVNGRPVRHPALQKALRQVFETLLEPTLSPFCFLELTVPAEQLDINIHPQKRQIRFLNEESILQGLMNQAAHTLEVANLTATALVTPWKVEQSSPQSTLGQHLKQQTEAWSPKELTAQEIGQYHDLYLILESPRGLYLIDQHAAHERILYEQFRAAWEKEQGENQGVVLDQPMLLPFSSLDAALLEEHLSDLQKLGFDLEPFRATQYALRAVPALLADKDPTTLIQQTLDDLHAGQGTLHPYQHRLLSYLACRTAIKAGDALTPEERRRLVEKLSLTDNRYRCPHGRPAIVEISHRELAQLFDRS